LIGIIGFVNKNRLWLDYARRFSVPTVLLGVGFYLLIIPRTQSNIIQEYFVRNALVGLDYRLDFWSYLLGLIVDRPVLGYGLRTAEHMFGRYSHSSYLDVLFETGLIGFALWLGFAMVVLKRGASRSQREFDMLPWFHVWLLTLLMFFDFSLLYNPFSWIVAGVLLADGSRHQARKPGWVPKNLGELSKGEVE